MTMATSFTKILKSISIAAMRHRVTIQRSVLTSDEAGGSERIFQAVDTVWASIEPVAGIAGVEAGREAQMLTHRIVMRWRNDVDAACRIVLGSRIFQIHAVADADEARRYLAVMAVEVRP